MEDKNNQGQLPRTMGEKVVKILENWGMPTVVAIALVCALYGVLIALGVISLTECTASYTQTADGDVHVQGSVVAPEKTVSK